MAINSIGELTILARMANGTDVASLSRPIVAARTFRRSVDYTVRRTLNTITKFAVLTGMTDWTNFTGFPGPMISTTARTLHLNTPVTIALI